ncbi:hypothetical protein ACHHYP_06699 [Achlya hypogyna]|uniref:Uncharacterized protein n=1 Tax=Achlya hypogyna TaxID=1202772 RepID=A0A1V9ZN63_ACHHY|nr:hypothetical protein ACHHYP_06699 [Achlya hypogyna]
MVPSPRESIDIGAERTSVISFWSEASSLCNKDLINISLNTELWSSRLEKVASIPSDSGGSGATDAPMALFVFDDDNVGVPVHPLSPRPHASALKSCLKSPTRTRKKKSLFRTTCVKFSTATTYSFLPTLGGCTVPKMADGASIGMAYYHTDVCVEKIPQTKRRGGRMEPMDLQTRCNLLFEIGCSADDIDNEWARIERLHVERTASQHDFPPDSAHVEMKRFWKTRVYLHSYKTSHKWFNRLGAKLRGFLSSE